MNLVEMMNPNNLGKQFEQLRLSKCLPPLQAILFLTGHKYPTGSDYSEEILNSSLEDLI